MQWGLVPTNGYYEWKTISGMKQPHFIRLKSGGLFALAGIWDVWTGAGSENWLETLALITKAASPKLQTVHHRMPLMLGPEDFSLWLGEGEEIQKNIFQKLDSICEDNLTIQKFSRSVNNVANEGPELLKPFGEAEIPNQGSLF
jgi:putative SOS response-associated peptidase YedK